MSHQQCPFKKVLGLLEFLIPGNSVVTIQSDIAVAAVSFLKQVCEPEVSSEKTCIPWYRSHQGLEVNFSPPSNSKKKTPTRAGKPSGGGGGVSYALACYTFSLWNVESDVLFGPDSMFPSK
jgi:hypothetical protein